MCVLCEERDKQIRFNSSAKGIKEHIRKHTQKRKQKRIAHIGIIDLNNSFLSEFHLRLLFFFLFV